VALAGTVWFGLFRSSSNVAATPSVAPAASPAPSQAATGPSPVASSGPSAATSTAPAADLAVGSPFPVAVDVVTGGATYHSVGFSEPLAFTMATYAGNSTPDSPGGYFNGQTIGAGHILHVNWISRDFGLMIVDDIRFPRDLCNPTADVLADIPATPDAVGQWLHGSAGLTVTDLSALTVAGRQAKAWDITLPAACTAAADPPDGSPDLWFQAGGQHRIYAVPTGADTILVITWPSKGSAAKENAETDPLVTSLRFH
ncbi:MAG TPA: hypothetical protein VK194_09960, partial [Candidatus Deferrimicrobium sp.]|nr:hypothetical protein [Candidatus Deferrimicrobium sp.]